MSSEQHARAFDLPGWTCPHRVNEIPSQENTWGWVHVSEIITSAVIQDENGYLWADGHAVPRSGTFRPSDLDTHPGAVLCWNEHGLGLYMHPQSRSLRRVPRQDIDLERWMPIAVALPELPGFVKEN
jgi:hypothetical protein